MSEINIPKTTVKEKLSKKLKPKVLEVETEHVSNLPDPVITEHLKEPPVKILNYIPASGVVPSRDLHLHTYNQYGNLVSGAVVELSNGEVVRSDKHGSIIIPKGISYTSSYNVK